MARATKEKQLADKLRDFLDTLDFDYHHFAYSFQRFGGAIQANAFELILALLNQWATQYQAGMSHDHYMYRMCEMAHRMMMALTTTR